MTNRNNQAPQLLQEWATRCSGILTELLPPEHQSELASAMTYACLGGGKRLRAGLIYATGEILGASTTWLDYPAAAMEMIHAYSLVHDDLPAMDDDDLRRGKPTCHIQYGEAMAILAGDALQTRAFEILGTADSGIPAEHRIQMVEALAQASGVHGMAGGQAIDLKAVGQRLDIEALRHMHNMKTGALIRCSVKLGYLCAGQLDTETRNALDRYATNMGLAFQIVDDILDETMDSDTLGKDGGSDKALNKPTYTTILGLETARKTAAALHEDALASLHSIRHNTEILENLADFVINRSH